MLLTEADNVHGDAIVGMACKAGITGLAGRAPLRMAWDSNNVSGITRRLKQ